MDATERFLDEGGAVDELDVVDRRDGKAGADRIGFMGVSSSAPFGPLGLSAASAFGVSSIFSPALGINSSAANVVARLGIYGDNPAVSAFGLSAASASGVSSIFSPALGINSSAANVVARLAAR